MKGRTKIGAGIMAPNGFIRVLGGGDFGQHFGVAVYHAGEIHHLAQADNAGPIHGLCDIVRADFKARGFKPRC